ncbi:hypothetical protein KFK09_004073 [Dendrobium nobile]|uniref:CCHC-type domain-containing protein n=1 Tax=Dendrobium nobile TaxID=94219 RepID=A0A8T3C4Y2_DENNO|nr:hypothetical protein KFK09_004073 [Dendrobium nobile]
MLMLLVPLYIAEISPQNMRGGLGAVNQLSVTIGILLAYILGMFVNWRALANVKTMYKHKYFTNRILPCTILIPGLFFIPESPRWLAKMGMMDDFESSLQVLRGFMLILLSVTTSSSRTAIRFRDLRPRRYKVPLMIGTGLLVLQQASGINGILFYASSIFNAAVSIVEEVEDWDLQLGCASTSLIAYEKEVSQRKIDAGKPQREKNISLNMEEPESEHSQPEDEDDIALMTKQFRNFLNRKQKRRQYWNRGKFNKNAKVSNEVICYECRELGHIKTDCPKLKSTLSKEKVKVKPIVKKGKKKFQRAFWADSVSVSLETEKEEEVTNLCLMADNLGQSDQEEGRSHTRPRESIWYLDSRYSKHMTRDTTQFILLEARSGDKVTLGENTIRKVIGSGKQVKSSFQSNKDLRTSKPLEILHMDLFGPVGTASIGGKFWQEEDLFGVKEPGYSAAPGKVKVILYRLLRLAVGAKGESLCGISAILRGCLWGVDVGQGKEIWDSLCITYEGKEFSNFEIVNKILRCLLDKFDAKVVAICESKNLNEYSIDNLIGSLIAYEECLGQRLLDAGETIMLKAEDMEKSGLVGEKSDDLTSKLKSPLKYKNKHQQKWNKEDLFGVKEPGYSAAPGKVKVILYRLLRLAVGAKGESLCGISAILRGCLWGVDGSTTESSHLYSVLSVLSLLGLVAFIISFSVGLGAIPWEIMLEHAQEAKKFRLYYIGLVPCGLVGLVQWTGLTILPSQKSTLSTRWKDDTLLYSFFNTNGLTPTVFSFKVSLRVPSVGFLGAKKVVVILYEPPELLPPAPFLKCL